MSGYKLTENWFSFVAENSDKVDCKHTALYFYIVEMFNKRQWVEVIGLPTDYTMGVLNIKSYKTYKIILQDLIDFGFVKMIESSKNQHTSNKIALVKNTKASSKHIPKQVQSTYQSNDQSDLSIIKLLNLETIKLINEYSALVNLNLQKWIDTELLIKNPNEEEEKSSAKKEEEDDYHFKPTLDDVKIVFSMNGGTDEMALKFFNKYSSTNWYLNNSPIKNFAPLAVNYIKTFKEIQNAKPTTTQKSARDRQADAIAMFRANAAAYVQDIAERGLTDI